MKRLLVGVFLIILPCTIAGQLAPPQSVAVKDDIFALRQNPAGLGAQPGFQFGVVASLTKGSGIEPAYYLGGGDQHGGTGLLLYKQGEFYHYRIGSSMALIPGLYLGYDVELG
ncbi:MAG: hypothetical protein P8Y60_14200, partial [Calditrichota bacterium]